MTLCRAAALAVLLALSGAGAASAAESVEPRAGVTLRGKIQFPRPQSMWVRTGARDSSRLSVAMGFNGRCEGGGLSEVFASTVAARPEVKVRDGRFDDTLTGVTRTLGAGRTGHFRWQFTGRFVERDVVVATVSGSGEVRSGGRTIARCKIAKPATVRLAIRAD